jgi:hypothetical protein
LCWQLATTSSAPEDRYEAAQFLLKCARAPDTTETQRKSLVDEAVQALALAAKIGFKNATSLKAAEWDPCRELPAFQKVLSDIAAKEKGTPPVPERKKEM